MTYYLAQIPDTLSSLGIPSDINLLLILFYILEYIFVICIFDLSKLLLIYLI